MLAGSDRYQVAHTSLRRIFDRILPAGGQHSAAATYFAAAAGQHATDIEWLLREQPNLLDAARTLLADGRAADAGALMKTLQPALAVSGQWSGWGRAVDLAEEAARASGDSALRAWALHERGTRAGLLGDRAAPAQALRAALALRRALGDRASR